MSRSLADRRGFALPAVILLVALLTVLLTSGLTRARTERELAEASDDMSVALAVAQSGLQTYMGTVVTRPADLDSARINVPGGFANVVVHLVRHPADTTERSLYLVRSTGFTIEPDSGAMPRALRTVAQFAEWDPVYLLRRAALTAANGMRKRPGAGYLRFSGNDDTTACSPTEAAVPGVRTTGVVVDAPNPVAIYEGSPGLIEEGGAADETIAWQTAIDWTGTLGTHVLPDYESFQDGDFSYAIQRIMGDLTLSNKSGSGLLIVSGDVDIDDFFLFRGVMLVGGDFDVSNNSYVMIRGLVVSGLNEQLGSNPGRNRFGSGVYADIQFASCYVQQALAPLRGLAPVRNAWLDTWATY